MLDADTIFQIRKTMKLIRSMEEEIHMKENEISNGIFFFFK